jgi:protein ImuB
MFACLHALTPATSALVEVARAFTPRFEVVGSLVMLDARGLSRIFGEPRELGRHLQAAMREVVPAARVAVASTQTTAALLALGRPGLTLVPAGQEAAMLAALPLDVLGEYERLRIVAVMSAPPITHGEWRRAKNEERTAKIEPRSVNSEERAANREERTVNGEERTANGEERTANREQRTANREPRAAGWRHPRDTHDAQITRRPKRPAARVRDEARVEDALQVLARWGVHTLGALSALPSGDLSGRLGPRGVRWQRLARGEDARPLVPWVETSPYEAALDLEWPIDGLEPLSFVLGRLLEPLTIRLERDDRGAAVLYTRLRLVSREAHTRVLQLPAPMRDAKALRTLMLLDLESHPPPAAIDQVAIALEPAPGRVVQEALFTRAVPPPEQVATLVARLTAVMGAGHVGTPSLVETWRPGAFTISPDFKVQSARFEGLRPSGSGAADTARPDAIAALRRFRFPVPARVRVVEGRPVRVMSDRHGVSGGAVMECAGPWRASGDWWTPSSYDRDEWDVAMADGTIYRIYVERPVGQWFIDGTID